MHVGSRANLLADKLLSPATRLLQLIVAPLQMLLHHGLAVTQHQFAQDLHLAFKMQT